MPRTINAIPTGKKIAILPLIPVNIMKIVPLIKKNMAALFNAFGFGECLILIG